jgi:hypothetical protein
MGLGRHLQSKPYQKDFTFLKTLGLREKEEED